MKRVQLFEFEDFSWFPDSLRNGMTNLIIVLNKMMGIHHVVADLVKKTLKEQNLNSIVDMGSGSGGIMPFVHETIAKDNENVQLTMTDLYPNPQAIKQFNSNGNDKVIYHETSVDATNLASAPKGLKTMVNCFHHLPPEKAKAALTSAKENNEPLLIYEMAENKMPLIAWWILLPISLVITFITPFFMTPFVKPLSLNQLFFTYIIPIIPLCYAWDGQASMPRMYTMKDFSQLLDGLETKSYTWKRGNALDSKGKKKGTFVIGIPK